MQVRKVAGRRYSDPDIVALIDEAGGLLDPQAAVKQAVANLLTDYAKFSPPSLDPLERMCILASLAGFEVREENSLRVSGRSKEGVLVPTSGPQKRGQIIYDPAMPKSRIIHTIGHEIVHSFIPTTSVGARYRSICKEGSPASREVEGLCDLGAAELTMPARDFTFHVKKLGLTIESVDQIRQFFGTSFEATLYRMAELSNKPVAAGLACFRLRVGEKRRAVSGNLFGDALPAIEEPEGRYRRQSLHLSNSFPKEMILPWNKSFPPASCIYRAANWAGIQRGYEVIPTLGHGEMFCGTVEALRAPYQPASADSDHPDILFLLNVE